MRLEGVYGSKWVMYAEQGLRGLLGASRCVSAHFNEVA